MYIPSTNERILLNPPFHFALYHLYSSKSFVPTLDMTNHHYFLLGDINVNLMPGVTSVNATKLNDIFEYLA